VVVYSAVGRAREIESVAVVAAVVVRDGTVLLARRKRGKARGGFWEFPGGKIETSETAEQALIREIAEEFCCGITVGEFLGSATHEYVDLEVHIQAYTARLDGNIACMTDHDARAWLRPAAIADYDLAPADEFLVPLLHSIL